MCIEIVDGPVSMRKSFGDWYVIERAHYEGEDQWEPTEYGRRLMKPARIAGFYACVEGSGEEMLSLAKAIKEGSRERFKRCGVDATGTRVIFSSPRNGEGVEGSVSMKAAVKLADQILEELG